MARKKRQKVATSTAQSPSGTWTVPPPGFDRWLQRMSELANFMRSHQFEIGDRTIEGENEFGARVWKAIEKFGYKRVSVDNIVRVCRAIPPDERHPLLRYSHHVQVYTLPRRERQVWLDRAETHDWNITEFQKQLKIQLGSRDKRKFGPPLNFRGLVYEPTEELGVVFLFGIVAKELGFDVEGVRGGFPDCQAKRRTKDGMMEQVDIEFEFKASNFKRHSGHDPKYCDLIVCWEDDWPSCPPELEVIELKKEIKRLESES